MDASSPVAGSSAPDLEFTCPRCGAQITARFYGPCTGCHMQLRAAMAREGRTTENTAFEPAMHVTPNAVATKD